MKKLPGLPSGAGELRRRAEHRLRKRPTGKARIETGADRQRLFQELQIHQIELELQNEELKQAKAEVDASLEKFTGLYDFAPVGYFSLDERGSILEVNLTGAALLGVERSRLVGRRFQLFVAAQGRPAFQAFLEKIFSGPASETCEVSLLKADHPPFWADLEAKSATTVGDAQKWCRVAVIDIAARKQAEEAQRRIDLLAATNRRLEEEIVRRQAVELDLKKSEQKLRRRSHQILLAQERQRKEISHALHDEISQLLLGIGVHLEIITTAPAIHPKDIRRTVARVHRIVKQSLKIVHQFARDLRPEMLDDLGLIPALRSYLADFSKRKGLKIQFAAFAGDEGLDNDQRTVLYRVAQEALANVAKHARASMVKVVLLKTGDGVRLEISDDGKAFDTARIPSAEWSGHLGLMGMRERVEMIGGRFSVVSAPGSGTTVRSEVPLGKASPDDLRRPAQRAGR